MSISPTWKMIIRRTWIQKMTKSGRAKRQKSRRYPTRLVEIIATRNKWVVSATKRKGDTTSRQALEKDHQIKRKRCRWTYVKIAKDPINKPRRPENVPSKRETGKKLPVRRSCDLRSYARLLRHTNAWLSTKGVKKKTTRQKKGTWQPT